MYKKVRMSSLGTTKLDLSGDAMAYFSKIHKFVENDSLTVLRMYTTLTSSGGPVRRLEIAGSVKILTEGVDKINEIYPNTAVIME